MAAGSKFLQAKAERKKKRVRSRILGTPEKPRLSIYRSLKEIYAQLVDDLNSKTITGLSSLSPAVKEKLAGAKRTKTEKAKLVGKILAETALAKGVLRVVFDRNRYPYHGRVKALAEGAREGGLKF